MQPPKEPCERKALVLGHKCYICDVWAFSEWTERTALPCVFDPSQNLGLAACKTLAALSCPIFAQTDATDV